MALAYAAGLLEILMVDDLRVWRFLRSKEGKWDNWNVPTEDGRFLHDLVLKEDAKNILEIGTSTAHSTIWLAWAAAKIQGKVLTIEIDHRLMEPARRHLKAAGLLKYVLQCQSDALRMVPYLQGQFDFIFSDGDRSQYENLFNLCRPLLRKGGIFVTHNVVVAGGKKIQDYLDFLDAQEDFETEIFTQGKGFSISRKINII